MKVAIIGGQNFNDKEIFKAALKPIFRQITLIISGGAPGADTMAEHLADKAKIPKRIHPADWYNLDVEPIYHKYNRSGRPYNALAGFIRNQKIIDECDIVYAFWDGKSHGTKDSIDKARKANKPVHIFNY